MQLRNRILLISAIIVAFLTIPSFATNDNEFVYSEDFTITDECFTYAYVTVFQNVVKEGSYYQLYVYYSNEEFTFVKTGDTYFNYDFSNGFGVYHKVFAIKNNVVSVYVDEHLIKSTGALSLALVNGGTINDLILFSDVDITDIDGNVVFQAPPSLERVTRKAQIIAGVVTQETLTSELAEMVPVGVTILATMILVSLVAYFPHWKG